MNNSNLLNLIGLNWIDPVYIWIAFFVLFIILIILHLVQMSKFRKLKEKYEMFMEGKEGKSLEDQFDSLFTDISDLKSAARRARRDVDALMNNSHICYQKMGLVKYDAFHEMGGKLSFALCMLDKDDNGFIINSVHSNTGCYTYTKEIVEGRSAIDLGTEEKEALDQAVSFGNSRARLNGINNGASAGAEKGSKTETDIKTGK